MRACVSACVSSCVRVVSASESVRMCVCVCCVCGAVLVGAWVWHPRVSAGLCVCVVCAKYVFNPREVQFAF